MSTSNKHDIGVVVESGSTPSDVEVESGREAVKEVMRVLRGVKGREGETRLKAILSYLSRILGVKPDLDAVKRSLERLVEEARREAEHLESMGLRGVKRKVERLTKRVEKLVEDLESGRVAPGELLAANLLANFARNAKTINPTQLSMFKVFERGLRGWKLRILDNRLRRIAGVSLVSIIAEEYERIRDRVVTSLFHSRRGVEKSLEEAAQELQKLEEKVTSLAASLEQELEKIKTRERLSPTAAVKRKLAVLFRRALREGLHTVRLSQLHQILEISESGETKGVTQQNQQQGKETTQQTTQQLILELADKVSNANSLEEATRLLSQYAHRTSGNLRKLLLLLSDPNALKAAVEAAMLYEWGSRIDDEALREVAGDKYALLAKAVRVARRFIRGGEKHTLLSRDIIENYDSESLTLRFIRSVVREIRKYSSYEQLLNAKAGEVIEQLEKFRQAGMALDEIVRRIEEKRRYHLVTIVKHVAGAAVQTPYGRCIRWVPPMPSARELLGMGGPVAETNPRQLAKALRDYLVGKRVRIYDAHGGLILSRTPNTVNDLESDAAYGALLTAVCQERWQQYMNATQNGILNVIVGAYGRRASKVRGIGVYLFPYPCPRYTGRGVVWLLDGKIVKLVGKVRTTIVFFADDGGKVVIMDPHGGSKEVSFTLHSPARVQLDGPAGVYRFRVLGYDYCIVGYQIVGPVVGA